MNAVEKRDVSQKQLARYSHSVNGQSSTDTHTTSRTIHLACPSTPLPNAIAAVNVSTPLLSQLSRTA